MNSVNLMGRLTAEPELKQTPNGISVCSVGIAVRENKEHTSFFTVVAWRGTTEMLAKYWHKGDMIGIAGKLVQRRWEDQYGNKRSAVEVVAGGVYFCGQNNINNINSINSINNEKHKADPQSIGTVPYSGTMPPESYFEEIGNEEDLPF